MPILRAMTFAISYAGFAPRSALETSDSGQMRLDKLISIIRGCKYSVHDISRVDAPASDPIKLPRFNMPFECGLFFGAMHFGGRPHGAKKLLVLDSEKFRAQKTMSDIAGNDPEIHGNSPQGVIACMRRFLNDKTEHKNLPGAEFLQSEYARFNAALPRLLTEMKVTASEIEDGAYWPTFVNIVEIWLRKFLGAPLAEPAPITFTPASPGNVSDKVGPGAAARLKSPEPTGKSLTPP